MPKRLNGHGLHAAAHELNSARGLFPPGLYKVMLFGIGTVAVQTFWKVLVALPSRRPLVDCHNLVAMPYRWVNFDRISLHDFIPFYSMNFGFRIFVDLGLYRSSKISIVQHVIRQR